MKTYTTEVYESHNSYYLGKISGRSLTHAVQQLKELHNAASASGIVKVRVIDGTQWAMVEGGKCEEASHANLLDK